MNPVEGILGRRSFMVLDGALGTEVSRRGFDTNDSLWSAKALYENPDLIRAVHRDYYDAGADVCTSASYQASVPAFLAKGFSRGEAEDLIRLSVRLAREARDGSWEARGGEKGDKPLVAASVGPYGAYLADGSEYTGAYALSSSELQRFHSERIGLLAEEHPDLFAVETLPLLREAEAVLDELRNYPDVSCWVSFSCRDAGRTCGGDPVRECAAALDSNPQVAAIGVNCTAPQFVSSLIREVRKGTGKPVLCYPNTGESYNPATKTWFGSPIPYRAYVRLWYEAGARLIGGCCRTTPEDIREIATFRASLEA